MAGKHAKGRIVEPWQKEEWRKERAEFNAKLAKIDDQFKKGGTGSGNIWWCWYYTEAAKEFTSKLGLEKFTARPNTEEMRTLLGETHQNCKGRFFASSTHADMLWKWGANKEPKHGDSLQPPKSARKTYLDHTGNGVTTEKYLAWVTAHPPSVPTHTTGAHTDSDNSGTSSTTSTPPTIGFVSMPMLGALGTSSTTSTPPTIGFVSMPTLGALGTSSNLSRTPTTEVVSMPSPGHSKTTTKRTHPSETVSEYISGIESSHSSGEKSDKTHHKKPKLSEKPSTTTEPPSAESGKEMSEEDYKALLEEVADDDDEDGDGSSSDDEDDD